MGDRGNLAIFSRMGIGQNRCGRVSTRLGSGETLRTSLADLMLRFSLFHRGVDRLSVAMRKIEWVGRNLESVSKGPLTGEEQRLLERLRNPARRQDLGWRRLLRRFLARA